MVAATLATKAAAVAGPKPQQELDQSRSSSWTKAATHPQDQHRLVVQMWQLCSNGANEDCLSCREFEYVTTITTEIEERNDDKER